MGAFKKSRAKVILIAQEIELARELASNNKATRDKAIRKLKKWFTSRSQGIHKFEKHDFLRIWKGLFYCMWMSDKPLIQEELAEEISNLVHSLVTVNSALMYIQVAFTALSIEWFGIDDLRINKFMMLVRRIVRQSFTLMQKRSWGEEDVKALADIYYSVLTETNSLGLKLHLIEIYCEELAKIGGEDLSADTVLSLVTPFAKYMATTKDGRLISHITRHVFLHLIHQSEAGIEFESRFNAWKQLGFAGGTIDAIQKLDPEELEGENDGYGDEEDEVKQNELDPRAGRVNVELPTLVFEPRNVGSMLTSLKSNQTTTVKARKTIVNLIQKFEKLSKGKFPLGIHKVDLPEVVPLKKEILHKSKQLIKKRLSKSEDKLEVEEDEFQETTAPKSKRLSAKLEWNVTEAKKEELGKENVAVLKRTNNWVVKPSAKRKSFNVLDVKEKPQTKRYKVNALSFKISETDEKSEVNKIKSIKSDGGRELNKMKNKKLKENGVQSKLSSMCEKVNESDVGRSVKKKKNTKKEDDSIKDSFSSADTNDWGKEWETGLEEGETEIFIPSKKYLLKLTQKGGSPAKTAFLKHHLGQSKEYILNPFALSPRNKKVEFALSLNTSQEHKEYRRSLKRKSDIPFDAFNQPKKGVLKSTPVGSPVNPFFQLDPS